MNDSVEQAYAACEAIARREAKNFYYAFLALPKRKRAAVCAVYAFMRHADDLADDDHLPREQRLLQSQQWLGDWHRVAAGESTSDPVFIALRDAQRRFSITTELLDQLVQGTMLDLTTPAAANSFATYHTFDELYRYCYLVASVVGLVCIRIFGYTEPRAEELAEQTGIAFQLTNILRDIKEDAERGRMYLPLDDLEQHHVTVAQVVSNRSGQKLTPDERGLLAMEAERARRYYRAAERLLPLISPDSRAALWVLVTIYRRLLDRIEHMEYQVFSTRVTVPTAEKIWILSRGLLMAFRLRLTTKSSSAGA
ncbi:MAG: phytoene/squalene synthase family protein [Acidobacteriaceae bacterium]